MNADKLIEALCDAGIRYKLPWLDGYTDFGSFRSSSDPKSQIRTDPVGKFLSVIIEISISGTTSDQTTDRASGDPYSGIVRYDWVGLAETAPKEVSTLDELNEWALMKTQYFVENTDVGLWGVHSGSFVVGIDEDGTVRLRDAEGSYQDEPPHKATTERTVKLEVL